MSLKSILYFRIQKSFTFSTWIFNNLKQPSNKDAISLEIDTIYKMDTLKKEVLICARKNETTGWQIILEREGFYH